MSDEGNSRASSPANTDNQDEEIGYAMAETQKLDVVPFESEAGMDFEAWLAYFESICVDNKKDELWRVKNIHKYLKGKALTVYINNCIEALHWEEILLLLREEFTGPQTVSIADFSEVKFKVGEDLNTYYQTKVKIGRKLGLSSKLILEALTDGLPLELRQLVAVRSPETTNQWREIVHTLIKIRQPEKVPKNFEQSPVPNQMSTFRPQWQTPRFRTDLSNNRPWTYRYPYQNPPQRGYAPVNVDNPPRMYRPPRNPSHVHFQGRLPSTPCPICTNLGILNAYHWSRVCPFRMQPSTPLPAPSPNLTSMPTPAIMPRNEERQSRENAESDC